MNWKNFTIGLLIAIVSNATGGYVGHLITLRTNKSNLEQMKPTLDKAIEKATNQITNEIKIDKIKKSDSISIIMDPNSKLNIETKNMCGTDSICMAIKHLTKRQKKRLKIN